MKKFGYGVLAFLPVIEIVASIVLMIVSIALMTAAAMGNGAIDAAVPVILLWVSIVGIILGIVLCVVGAVVFCAHVKKNENIEEDSKKMWMVSLITLVCFSFPVYWVKCIHKVKK